LTSIADVVKLDYSTWTITITHAHATNGNWYNEFILRGFSTARNNSQIARDNYVDYRFEVDICGWEITLAPTYVAGSTVFIPEYAEHFVEVGTNRSWTKTFSNYITNSTTYPSWHATKAG